MPFRIRPLPKAIFEPLFHLSSEDLPRHGAVRQTVTKKPGFPCRVSLADAEIGEEVLLVHYEHQSANTPFRASHAVYVRPGADQANLGPNEVPEQLRSRILSLRGFDAAGMMVHADLADGRDLEAAIDAAFILPHVEYIHLHYAKPGCYAARIDREEFA
jgi:hypothetical protein